MKLYLDTNVILGWFKRIMQSKRKSEEFKLPSVIKFLTQESRIELIVSNLTKTEIFRYLKSDWNSEEKFSKEIWETFLRSFNLKYIEAEIDAKSIEELSELCLKINTKKRTLTNLLHLEVARRYNLTFLTGEKKLKEKYSKYYSNIITYKELRQKLS